MTTSRHSRHHRPVGEAAGTPAPISRLAYESGCYRRPAEAIAGMRAQLLEGWRIVQIRGPADGPFEVAYLREVRRDR